MPTALEWLALEASQPAYSTPHDAGGVALNSMSATSEAPLFKSNVPPEMLLLVGPVLPEQVALSWLK